MGWLSCDAFGMTYRRLVPNMLQRTSEMCGRTGRINKNELDSSPCKLHMYESGPSFCIRCLRRYLVLAHRLHEGSKGPADVASTIAYK